ELKNLIALKRQEGRPVDDLLVLLYQRFSIPFACFIFALIGAPAGMKPNRSGSSIGLGLSIVIIFIYYLLMTFGSALGQDGVIPPVIGAWIQNIVFGGVGLYMLLKAAR
ncbi:MAG: LptF/LptG family permease, partial [Halanaerobium sp.]|nr:LptF/LptG family permease [Halanaerobium sp.]